MNGAMCLVAEWGRHDGCLPGVAALVVGTAMNGSAKGSRAGRVPVQLLLWPVLADFERAPLQ
jgi:hypothetical protein